jgi:4-azaleucine resistance transporter AzlC
MPEAPVPDYPRTQGVRFTAAGLRAGYVRTIPVGLGVSLFGIVFGLVAGQKGLSVLETGLMSALVFAGASQMLAMELWTSPVPVLTVAIAALVINLRYFMMNAALMPWLQPVGPLRAYGSLFFTADENWAVSVAEMRSGGRDAGFLLGSGLAIWTFWLTATLIGRTTGTIIADPERVGVDFVGTAVFTFLLVRMHQGKGDWLPWTVAGVTAVTAAEFLPGFWYLILGGLAGSIAGALRDVR